MWDPEQEERIEPFRVTPGFIAFVAAIFVPVILGIVIVIGAWAVSDEVYAAEASQSRFADAPVADEDVDGWKRSLVGICPIH